MVKDSQTSPKLPVIDFSGDDLKTGTSSWVSTRKDVHHALEEYGCFEAVYDKVTPQLHDAICHSIEDLFDLPVETKGRYTFDVPLYGYSGPSPQAPLREAVNIKDAPVFEETQSFTSLMWPSGNEHFCETVNSYSKVVSELDQMITRMVFESFNVEKYYDPHINSTAYVLRVIKYRQPQTNETNVGVAAHADITLVTILHQNQVDGLEIQTKDGIWIPVSPSASSSFIVIAGHPFMVWSNGRIHAATHRVIMNGSKVRYSLGMFSFNTGVIQPPEELIDEEHPLKYKPFNHLEMARSFLVNKGTISDQENSQG